MVREGKTGCFFFQRTQGFPQFIYLDALLSHSQKSLTYWCTGGCVLGASKSISRPTLVQDDNKSIEVLNISWFIIFFSLILTRLSSQRWKYCRKLIFFIFIIVFFNDLRLLVVISSPTQGASADAPDAPPVHLWSLIDHKHFSNTLRDKIFSIEWMNEFYLGTTILNSEKLGSSQG